MSNQYKLNNSLDIKSIYQDEIDEFRKHMEPLLKKYPCYDTDYSLLRWLRGSKFDKEVAGEKMKWSLNTINTVGAFDKNFSSVEEIETILKAVSPFAEYFPGGIIGYDKNGYVIILHNIGKAHPRSLIGAERVSQFYINSIYGYEATQCLIRSEEAKRGCKLGAVVIIDLSGFSYDIVFHLPATKIYISAIIMLQDMFPDIAVKLYVVNTPTAVQFLLRMVLMNVAKETVDLLEFLGNDWKDILLGRHGAKFLPKRYGGLLGDDIFRKGGEVPNSVAQMNKKYVADEKLKKITVSARDEAVINISVEKPNSKLSWYFVCSSGDIDFCVLFEKQEVWPRFRIYTEFTAEYNEIVCKEVGTYQLLFSNKHGRVWSKCIQYYIDVKQPPA
uniref:CRAL-TRIO domain-containing protein n=1 Tax=Wuchereria bancrofti TaxID=6293 RepID=A0A1I8EM29_WUCBA